jgi:hypothetical protein
MNKESFPVHTEALFVLHPSQPSPKERALKYFKKVFPASRRGDLEGVIRYNSCFKIESQYWLKQKFVNYERSKKFKGYAGWLYFRQGLF